MSQPHAKYIVITHPEFIHLELPIMFAESLPHALVGRGHHVVSAGFCSVSQHEAHAWGGSHGLKIDSRPIDEELLRRAFCWTKGPAAPASGQSHATAHALAP